jgi:transcription elongation factor Elf1
MKNGRYDERDQPAIRAAATDSNGYLRDYACPFCGIKSVLISLADIEADHYRVELYCDNGSCEVREFTVLPLRMNGPVSRVRTDVAALDAVDRGSEDEQNEEASEIFRSGEGEKPLRMYSPSAENLKAHDAAVLHRRQRKRRVVIEPPS